MFGHEFLKSIESNFKLSPRDLSGSVSKYFLSLSFYITTVLTDQTVQVVRLIRAITGSLEQILRVCYAAVHIYMYIDNNKVLTAHLVSMYLIIKMDMQFEIWLPKESFSNSKPIYLNRSRII